MYFCPCSCNDPIDPEAEENALVALPRNLSYVQESYLDRYSSSANFVHNPKLERRLQHEQGLERTANVEEEQRRLIAAVLREEANRVHNSEILDYTQRKQTLVNWKDHHVLQPVSTNGEKGDSSGASTNPFVFHRPDCVHATHVNGASLSVSARSPSDFVTSPPSEPKSPLPTEVEVGCPPPVVSGQSRSLFGPVERVAHKLSALLHSPPNESMDEYRDVGSSVDGDVSTPITSPPAGRSDLVLNPDHFHQQIDRGLDVEPIASGDDRNEQTSSAEVVPEQHVVICDKTAIHDFDAGSESDVPTESEAPDLYPKPFGHGGKTYFPRTDMSLSSSDQEDDIMMEDGEPEAEEPEVEETIKMVSDNKPSDESPDSDAFIEEGVFLNMDDLDSTHERSNTVSEVSDDNTCVSEDSVILSPSEGELEEEGEREDEKEKEEETKPIRKMSIEEAIHRAASDLNRMTMHEDHVASSMEDSTSTLEGDDHSQTDTIQPVLAAVGRESPLRTLKIPIPSGNLEMQRDSYAARIESPVYAESEFNFCRTTLRKSSSLKTNKTPPGTPHRKKVVRFADAMGLDLESVRHVLNMESPPRIPPSAMADLRAGLDDDHKEIGSRYLCPCFTQPGAEDSFHHKIHSQKICLENAIVTDLTITGIVRVANVSYHKSVRVRYSHNNWATFHDIAATYCLNSCDGPTDRFSFSIVAPPDFSPGRRLQFAISYNAGGVEYWDSNDGKNYTFECFAKTVPLESETAWMHFI